MTNESEGPLNAEAMQLAEYTYRETLEDALEAVRFRMETHGETPEDAAEAVRDEAIVCNEAQSALHRMHMRSPQQIDAMCARVKREIRNALQDWRLLKIFDDLTI